jgi:proteasome accessory factor B
MKTLLVSGRTFARPADFSPEKYFANAFGAFVGSGDYRVTIRFGASVADQIRERFWHESQETTDLSDGRLEFSIQVSSLDEILRWVLGWAGHAEVIAPAELQHLVRASAEATVRRYAPQVSKN